jgi:predicted amidohydrolase YtcJ
MELRWDGVPSLPLALEMLKEQAQRTPPPQWVRVIGGWSQFQFAEKRMPILEEINAAAPDTPVLEFQRDWANREHYDALLNIFREHGGAYGDGIDYAYTMVHKAQQAANTPHIVSK